MNTQQTKVNFCPTCGKRTEGSGLKVCQPCQQLHLERLLWIEREYPSAKALGFRAKLRPLTFFMSPRGGRVIRKPVLSEEEWE